MPESPSSLGNEVQTACGGTIKKTDQFPSVIFRGERIYFCTPACFRAFEIDPERFMTGEIEHPTNDE
jgi:YHS domain-containing protein